MEAVKGANGADGEGDADTDTKGSPSSASDFKISATKSIKVGQNNYQRATSGKSS